MIHAKLIISVFKCTAYIRLQCNIVLLVIRTTIESHVFKHPVNQVSIVTSSGSLVGLVDILNCMPASCWDVLVRTPFESAGVEF